VRKSLAPVVEAGGQQAEAVTAALKGMRASELLGGY